MLNRAEVAHLNAGGALSFNRPLAGNFSRDSPAANAARVAGRNDNQGRGQITQHVHHNVQAMDRAGVERVLGRNNKAVYSAMMRAAREGNLI
jgi:hypothetical protein